MPSCQKQIGVHLRLRHRSFKGRKYLVGANFQKADIRECDFSSADLEGADLEG